MSNETTTVSTGGASATMLLGILFALTVVALPGLLIVGIFAMALDALVWWREKKKEEG